VSIGLRRMSGFGAREKLDVAARTHPPLAVFGGQECLVLSERLEAFGAEVALLVEGHPHRGVDLSEGHGGLFGTPATHLERGPRMRVTGAAFRQTGELGGTAAAV
jgi:hypothetical protein